jgi:hypothetical protein
MAHVARIERYKYTYIDKQFTHCVKKILGSCGVALRLLCVEPHLGLSSQSIAIMGDRMPEFYDL